MSEKNKADNKKFDKNKSRKKNTFNIISFEVEHFFELVYFRVLPPTEAITIDKNSFEKDA